jgi:protein TonB
MKPSWCIACSLAAAIHAACAIALHAFSLAHSHQTELAPSLVAMLDAPVDPIEPASPVVNQQESAQPQPWPHIPPLPSRPRFETIQISELLNRSISPSQALSSQAVRTIGAAIASSSRQVQSLQDRAARMRTIADRLRNATSISQTSSTSDSGISAAPQAASPAAASAHATSTSPQAPSPSATGLSDSRGPIPADGNPSPIYPPQAARSRTQGTVGLAVVVTATGHAVGARVLTTSGNKLLDDAALATVLTWRFHPAIDESGRAVECEATTSITFRLRAAP